MEYRTKCKISWDDYKNFNIAHLKNALRSLKSIISIIILLISIAFIVTLELNDFIQGTKSFIGSITYYISFITMALAVMLIWRIPKSWKDMYKSNTILHNEQEISIDSQKIKQINANGSLEISRDEVHDLLFTKNAVYVYIGKSQAIIIADHYFADLAFAELKEFIRSNFSKKLKA